MLIKKTKNNSGFTLVELLVGVAVFSIIVVSVYNAYMSIFDVVKATRAKIEAVNLINEQLEIVRNLPYSSVGIVGGIPSGVLTRSQIFTRDKYKFYATTTVRNIDDPFDGTLGGTPNDLSPADFKIVEIEVNCTECRNFKPMAITTKVSPKNLETASTNGALFIKVFDANGDPVQNASVHLENNQVVPAIVIDDVTNNTGMLQIVDAVPGVNAYEITVTKSGYSTDKTYAIVPTNPNPTKPHATVLLQQVTQISFIIDKLSTFSVSSVTDSCSPVSSIDFSMQGQKLIGTSPEVLKYKQDKVTNSSGILIMEDVEWDTYSISATDASYDLIGINPPSPVVINPNSSQNLQLVMAPKDPDTLLVTVRDSSTNLPLSGVETELTKTGYTATKITGQGFVTQTDWSGGSGQATSTDATKYFSSDGNIEIEDPVGDISLKDIFGDFLSSGVLESSAFDIGSISNFHQISWNPVDQPTSVGTPNVRLQIATNNDGYTWNFIGPDGTDSSYYSNINGNISSANDDNRYIRYKIFLDTATTTATPNISDVSFTYTSLCTPPGQVSFSGLSAGTYTLNLTKSGYNSQNVTINIDSAWQNEEIIMTPN